MGDNVLKPVIDGIWGLGVMATNFVKSSSSCFLSWNEHDFDKFFKASGLKNSEGEKPKLSGWVEEDIYNLYKFEVPAGLCLGDFEKRIEPIALFMKTDLINIKFKVAEDFSKIHLYELKFNQLFKTIELKNSEGIYPKLYSANIDDKKSTYIFSVPEDIKVIHFKVKLKGIKNIGDFEVKEIYIEDTPYIELKI